MGKAVTCMLSACRPGSTHSFIQHGLQKSGGSLLLLCWYPLGLWLLLLLASTYKMVWMGYLVCWSIGWVLWLGGHSAVDMRFSPIGYLHSFASASSAQSCPICFRDLSTCSVGKCWKSKRGQLSHETIRPALHQRRVPSPHWGLCHGFDFSICRNFIAFVKLGTFLRRHSQSIPKWNFLWRCRGLRADVELNTSDWSTLSATCGLAGTILLGGPLSTEQQSQLELCNSFGSLFHEPSLGARFSFYNPCVALLHMALGAVIWHGWGGFLFSGLGQKVLAVQCLFSDAFLAPLPLGPGAKDQILKYVNFIKILNF